MIVLLEGADGVGKSTLARELCEEYGYDYLHFLIPDEHPVDYWFKELVKIKRPTVIDRLHLSEDAYGPIFREGSQLSDLDRWLVEGWLWARRAVLVVCATSWENMRENLEKVNGPYHDDRQRAVAASFTNLTFKTTLPYAHYDYSEPRTAAFPRELIDVAHHGKRQEPMRECFSPNETATAWNQMGLGNSERPRVWLVGERQNPRQDLREIDKQVVFRSGSGNYLRRAMHHLEMFWDVAYVSNAYWSDGRAHDLECKWEYMGRPAVVALGNAAAHELERQGVPFQKVSHPQWRRRFKHHDLEGYADDIRKAADWR